MPQDELEFEWDKNRRWLNLARHGIEPLRGAELFDGRAGYTYPSPRGTEERFVSVARLDDRLVALVWAKRDTAIRLISLRSARDAEKDEYRARGCD